MTRLLGLIAAVAAGVMLGGCTREPVHPADSLFDAIRAEETGGGNLTYGESQGKALFAHYCATCHGDEGHGDGQNSSNLTPPPPDLAEPSNVADRALLEKVIGEGSASVGRSPLSPPWGRSLSRQEIEYLADYCQALARAE